MNFFNSPECLRNKTFYSLLASILLLAACAKKQEPQKSDQLAQTYFKMAFLELTEDADAPHVCKRALMHIDQALVQCKKPEYYALKATLLFKLSAYSESETCFKKALELESDPAARAEISNNYACLLAQKGEVARAEALWVELKNSSVYQTPEVALVNLGKLHVQQKSFAKAKTAFQDAAYLSPSYLDAHFYLAVVAQQLGDRTLVRQELETVLSLEPEHQGAKMALAQISS